MAYRHYLQLYQTSTSRTVRRYSAGHKNHNRKYDEHGDLASHVLVRNAEQWLRIRLKIEASHFLWDHRPSRCLRSEERSNFAYRWLCSAHQFKPEANRSNLDGTGCWLLTTGETFIEDQLTYHSIMFVMSDFDSFICGFAYGVTTVVVGQPLDTIKTRMQAKGTGCSMISTATSIFKRSEERRVGKECLE